VSGGVAAQRESQLSCACAVAASGRRADAALPSRTHMTGGQATCFTEGTQRQQRLQRQRPQLRVRAAAPRHLEESAQQSFTTLAAHRACTHRTTHGTKYAMS
jgi:hypothetical protein